MNKSQVYDELTKLLNGYYPMDIDDIIINLCNYFDSNELTEFINFLKDERN